MTSTVSSTSCPARWATPRTADRPTLGGRDRIVAKALGLTLADWQLDVLDTAGELEVDRHGRPTGRMSYPVVGLVVPRRAGKTLLAQVRQLAVAVGQPARRCWYTAHRREVASALWRDEWFPLLEGSRMKRALMVRRSNGSETVTVRKLGSTVRLFAPSGEALRSQNADNVTVDEAREFTVEEGDQLEAAVRPAQARRRGRQLWVVSSAGDASSTWLARLRDTGRAAVEAGERSGVAWFEWAAPPGLDPYDPVTIRAAHPAVADGSVDVETILADAATMDPARFTTEYLGWWHDGTLDHPIPLDLWAARADPAAAAHHRPVWAFDVAADRSRASIVRAAGLDDDQVVLEVVDDRPGVSWVADQLRAVRAHHPHALIVADSLAGASIIADLTRHHVDVTTYGATELARACSALVDDLHADRVHHRAQQPLDDAVAGAARRTLGDGWAWSRRHSATSIAPLVAATLALWGWRTQPAPQPVTVLAPSR